MRKLAALISVLAVSVGIAACGGGDDKTVTVQPAPQTQQQPVPQPAPQPAPTPEDTTDLKRCGGEDKGSESGVIYAGGNSDCAEAARVIVTWGQNVQSNPPESGTTSDERTVDVSGEQWTCNAQVDNRNGRQRVVVACVSADGGKVGFVYTRGGVTDSFS